jgi:hypothetical protein
MTTNEQIRRLSSAIEELENIKVNIDDESMSEIVGEALADLEIARHGLVNSCAICHKSPAEVGNHCLSCDHQLSDL